ncbi:MAG: phosphoribosyltransferase [Deltaproteobacteria bacterium]|nr:phosphoribosyltransferase [Deltaproteobacteria bacterium]
MIIDLSGFMPPQQSPITRDRIEAMTAKSPRRMKLSREWGDPLHPPRSEGRDWSLVLPFCETLGGAFEAMCPGDHIGMRTGANDRCYTFFPKAQNEPSVLDRVRAWLETVGCYVAIRDCLALSFALDYEREGGNPAEPQTVVAHFRSLAKPYERQPTAANVEAADRLVAECAGFLGRVTCYTPATCVVGMPSSSPDKPFNLTWHLAAGIAVARGLQDRSQAVRTVRARSSVRETRLSDKLAVIEGSVAVDRERIAGEIVLLVDDLYQSGISMNYVAMLLLEAGAKKVFGLACEKTCTNDDNVSRGHRS